VLAQLTKQAKTVEEAFADLANVTDTAAAERRDRAHTAATAASEQFDRNLVAADASATANWRAMQAGIDQQIKTMQDDIAARKQAHDVHQAEQHADTAKARAAWAASYAVAATEMARLAALDADVARREAAARKQQ
jgi:hypothetical protein